MKVHQHTNPWHVTVWDIVFFFQGCFPFLQLDVWMFASLLQYLLACFSKVLARISAILRLSAWAWPKKALYLEIEEQIPCLFHVGEIFTEIWLEFIEMQVNIPYMQQMGIIQIMSRIPKTQWLGLFFPTFFSDPRRSRKQCLGSIIGKELTWLSVT